MIIYDFQKLKKDFYQLFLTTFIILIGDLISKKWKIFVSFHIIGSLFFIHEIFESKYMIWIFFTSSGISKLFLCMKLTTFILIIFSRLYEYWSMKKKRMKTIEKEDENHFDEEIQHSESLEEKEYSLFSSWTMKNVIVSFICNFIITLNDVCFLFLIISF